MEPLDKHIAELDRLLKAKGYDGFFLSASGYPGRLAESLTAFCRSHLKGGEYGMSFPPALTTYTYWGGERKESVRCYFTLDYQESSGFKVKSVEMESQNRYGFTDNSKVVNVVSDADIPTRQQAKTWALNLRSARRIKNVKH